MFSVKHAALLLTLFLCAIETGDSLFWPFNIFTEPVQRINRHLRQHLSLDGHHGGRHQRIVHDRSGRPYSGSYSDGKMTERTLQTRFTRIHIGRKIHPRAVMSYSDNNFATKCLAPRSDVPRRVRRKTLSSPRKKASISASREGFKIKVLNLNTWGLLWPWSQDKEVRFEAIRNVLRASDYDVVLLQEVWSRSDYDLLCSVMPYITKFDSFNDCYGHFLPLGCSGLVIMSRYPLVEVEFMPFSSRGSPLRLDGEIFVAKGVGRARIVVEGVKIDFYTTHLISYTISPSRDNNEIRIKQTSEMLEFIRDFSDADVKIFGGDINALPLQDGPTAEPYQILTSHLNDALLANYEFGSFLPYFASYGNKYNSHSQIYTPQRIDYILYWARSDYVQANVAEFTMPIFVTNSAKSGQLISISDHEALQTTFQINHLNHTGT